MLYKDEIPLATRKELMLDMLRFLMKFCNEHNLRVYLAGGTLLGAVRHKGFIPWDDDVDVMMPFDDWCRLMELTKNDFLTEKYFFSTLLNNSFHMWPFIKMINRETILVEPMLNRKLQKAQEKFYGVYIDIFPMYGLPNDRKRRIDYQNQMVRLYEKYKKATRVMNRRPQDNFITYKIRSVLYIVYCLHEKIYGGKKYLKEMYEMMKTYPLIESEVFGWATGIARGEKDHIYTNEMDNVCLLEFEGLQFPAFKNYDLILRNQYGDYMQLPPIEQRHVHPSNVRWRE